MRPSFRRAGAAATAAVIVLSGACGPGRLTAEQCREEYLNLPGRQRVARESSSAEARQEFAEQAQRFVDDHPECRP